MKIEYIEIFRMECIDKKISINYNRNQYIKIYMSVEKVANMVIDINSYKYNDKEKIEDLELKGNENVLIYKNEEGNGEEFINIYSGIRIMRTTEKTINEDRYKKLPESVDYVIVDGKIYEVKDEFDMMKFKSEKRFMEYIGEMERQCKINENNKIGETALMIACSNKMERVAMELIGRMSEEGINKWNNKGETALYLACHNNMENIALKLIPKMSSEAINKLNNFKQTILIACRKKMERVAIELIPRMSEEAINKWDATSSLKLDIS